MIRLTELHGGQTGSAAVRRGPASFEVFSLVRSARAFRSHYVVERLYGALATLSRWMGLTGFVESLRRHIRKRRTLNALASLDDRLLKDIGVARADIEATAALCSNETPRSATSLWRRLAAWMRREADRRRTERELYAMSDELLRDIGIERSEIPAVAAAVVGQKHVSASEAAGDRKPRREALPPRVSAQVIAFTEQRRRPQRHTLSDHDRSTAA